MLEKNSIFFYAFKRKTAQFSNKLLTIFLNREKDFCKYHYNCNDICNANIYFQHNILFNIS